MYILGRDSVSGIPDGMGGMLPALKQGVGVGVDTFSLNKPPPLSLQVIIISSSSSS